MKNALRILMITGLVLAANQVQSQAWNTIGGGLSSQPSSIAAYADSNELYVAYTNFSPQVNIRLERWNGLNWAQAPQYVPTSTWTKVNATAAYNGDVYVGTTSNLLKFDGSSWSVMGNYSVNVLEVINNELFIGAEDSILIYDGSGFTNLGTLPTGFTPYDVEYFNSQYCISGTDSSFVNSPISTLKWDGMNWESAADFFSGTPFQASSWTPARLFSLNNELFVHHFGLLYEIASDTAHFIATVDANVREEINYNGKVYLVTDSLTTAGGVSYFDGTTVTVVLGAPKHLISGAVYDNELAVFSSYFNYFNGFPYNYAFRTQANFSVLNGTAYRDVNSDCFFNSSSETRVPGIIIVLNDSNAIATDSDGNYSIAVEAGTYTIDSVYSSQGVGKNIVISCPLPSSVNIGSGQTITQNLALSNPVSTDAQTFVTGTMGWRARHGFTNYYHIDVNNAGNATLGSATVNVLIPPTVTVQSLDPPATSVSGNVYTFDFLNVQPLESRRIEMSALIDVASNSLGDTLTWVSYLDPVPGDADLSDNTDTLKQQVTTAFDPNDKQASAYSILPGTETIDYQIRFQNTGNDTALRVVVIDTLDMTLPITRIVINSASHPYSLAVNNNILIWEFDHIMLPDSGTDMAGSQGYIRFSAGLDPNLNAGDTVRNDAHIFFDFQYPVHTNVAKTAVVTSISLEEHEIDADLIKVYPNPSSDVVYLLNESGVQSIEFHLMDQSGRVLDRIRAEPGIETEYKVSSLSSGIYYLVSPTQTYKVIVTR